MKHQGPILILSTVPDLVLARSIANDLLDKKLAACVSFLPGLESHYTWEGKKESAIEIQLFIKTTVDCYKLVEERLRELHPYECPEVLAIPIKAGYEEYLKWVAVNCRPLV